MCNCIGMETFIAVISCWKDNPELAADIGVTPSVVALWKHRDSIPADYWPHMVGAAERRGFSDITYALLARILAAKKGTKRANRARAA